MAIPPKLMASKTFRLTCRRQPQHPHCAVDPYSLLRVGLHQLLSGLWEGLARTRKWQFPDESSIRSRGIKTSIGHFTSSVILMIRSSSASSVFSGRIRQQSEENLTRYDRGQSFPYIAKGMGQSRFYSGRPT